TLATFRPAMHPLKRKELRMSAREDHRSRSRAMWHQVMRAEPPAVNEPNTKVPPRPSMAPPAPGPGLPRRDRRLVTLTIAAVADGPLRIHLRASLDSGDLSIEELHEWVFHPPHSGG